MADRFTVRQSVFIVLRNENDEILLEQRVNTGYLDGYWDLPSGHVEYGESIRNAAVRELMEEVGVTVSGESLRLIHLDQFYLDQNYTNYTFAVDVWTGLPLLCEPDKASAIGWFSPRELPEMCVNVVRVNEQTGFSDELTYSVTDRQSYHSIMGTES